MRSDPKPCDLGGCTTGPWLSTARNVALFANEDGTYDELAAYLRKRKLA